MAIRTASTIPDFDSIARIYRWMEYLSFGPLLERCRFHFLARCENARHALLLGDGDGRFTARLLATNSSVQIDAIDSSAAMLTQLERRACRATADAVTRLHTIQGDIRSYTPDRAVYDLVVSHFFLDCLTDEEVTHLVQRTTPHLTPNATWLISEFAIPEKGWRQVGARALVSFLYFAFKKITRLHVRTIPDYAKVLCHCGFQLQQQAQFLGGLVIAQVWKRHDGSL